MSRFIDERGRIFGRVNVVDVVVLLVIAAIVALAVVRFADEKVDSVPVRVTYTVERARPATVEALNATLSAKGTVTDQGGTVLGKVEEVVATPTLTEVVTPEGELKLADSPLYSDLNIVVLGEGVVSGSNVRIGSVAIRVGQKETIVGTGFELEARIMRVTWGAEAEQ